MPATQISFADFAAQALALQAVTPCPPSIVAVHAPAPVVAHGGDDAGECIAPCVNEWTASHWARRLSRHRAIAAGRSVARWGVDFGGVVVSYRSRARAFNNAARYPYARLVEVCQ